MNNIKRFDIAANCLSKRLSELFLSLDETDKNRIREIRIRKRRPMTVITENGTEFMLASGRLTRIYSSLTVVTVCKELKD